MEHSTILIWLERHGISEVDLDEMVHEVAMGASIDALNHEPDPSGQEEILSAGESAGSAINNGGLARQVEFLVSHHGSEKLAAEAIAKELELSECFCS